MDSQIRHISLSHTHTHTHAYAVTKLDVLPFCNYKAAYSEPRTIEHYKGWRQVRESSVYPNDETWTSNMLRPAKIWSWTEDLKHKGNGVISDKVGERGRRDRG